MKRSDIMSRLPVVQGLNQAEAAAFIGVSTNTFVPMVNAGTMPKPRLLGGRKIWDIDELRAAFKSLPREGEEGRRNTWADVA